LSQREKTTGMSHWPKKKEGANLTGRKEKTHGLRIRKFPSPVEGEMKQYRVKYLCRRMGITIRSPPTEKKKEGGGNESSLTGKKGKEGLLMAPSIAWKGRENTHHSLVRRTQN